MNHFLTAVLLVLMASTADVSVAQNTQSEAEETTPVEVGRVNWSRDLDAALAQSRSDGRPVLLLFQEVPG